LLRRGGWDFSPEGTESRRLHFQTGGENMAAKKGKAKKKATKKGSKKK
jgi:hypothetical protein